MDVVNMKDYGVPQSRRRFSLIATRLQDKEISLPVKENKVINLENVLGEKMDFHVSLLDIETVQIIIIRLQVYLIKHYVDCKRQSITEVIV